MYFFESFDRKRKVMTIARNKHWYSSRFFFSSELFFLCQFLTKSAWKLSELTDPYIHQNVIMPGKSFIYKIWRDVPYDIMYTPCQTKGWIRQKGSQTSSQGQRRSLSVFLILLSKVADKFMTLAKNREIVKI